MTRLDLSDRQGEVRRANWGLVISIVATALTAIGMVLAFSSGVFGDYRKLGERVTTLETQRIEDVKTRDQQRSDDARWRERIENKIDALLQRGKS